MKLKNSDKIIGYAIVAMILLPARMLLMLPVY